MVLWRQYVNCVASSVAALARNVKKPQKPLPTKFSFSALQRSLPYNYKNMNQ